MDLLLNDAVAPITTVLSFIESGIENCALMIQRWQREILEHRKIGVKEKRISSDLASTLGNLLPLQRIEANRFLLISTRSGWTAYFDNRYRGTDGSGIGYLAECMKCRTVQIHANPHRPGTQQNAQGRPGRLILTVWGPEKTDWLNRVRDIRLWNDVGKWEFEESGAPFSFEDTDKYRARKKTERFRFEMLLAYAKRLGLSPFEEAFYKPASSILIELRQESGVGVKYPLKADNVTLEEARRLNGITV